jgi:hypothetical protein
MRVLWATANLPDPTRGGGPSIEHEHLRWACAAHEVTLITGGLRGGEALPAVLAALPLAEVVAAGADDRPAPGRLGLLARSLTGAPYELDVAQPRVARIQAEVERRPADLVHVMWAETAPVAIAAARRGPTAFWPSDSFTRHAERRLATATSARQRAYWRLQRARTRAWERAYVDAGAVGVVSAVDAAALGELGVVASVVPSALAEEWFVPWSGPRDPDVVAFVGALDYGPNVEAVGWLLRDLWPRLVSARPALRLRVVGRRPLPELVRAVAATPGAELVADAPEVRSHYGTAAVVIVPVRQGSGVRTKVLHAMACHAPLVSTSTAVEGIAVRDGEHLLLADTADGLVDATLRALADPGAAAERADRAALLAAESRTDRVVAALEALWDRARREGS